MTLNRMTHNHKLRTAMLVVALAALLPAMAHGIHGNQIDPPFTPPAAEISIECATVSAGVATNPQGMVFNVGQRLWRIRC